MTGITKSVVIVLLGSSDQLIHYLVPSNSLQALLPEIQLLHTASLPSPDTPPRIGRILQLLEAIFLCMRWMVYGGTKCTVMPGWSVYKQLNKWGYHIPEETTGHSWEDHYVKTNMKLIEELKKEKKKFKWTLFCKYTHDNKSVSNHGAKLHAHVFTSTGLYKILQKVWAGAWSLPPAAATNIALYLKNIV